MMEIDQSMGLHRRPSPLNWPRVRFAAVGLGLGLVCASGPLAAQTVKPQPPGTPPAVQAAQPPAPLSNDPAALIRQRPAPVTSFPYLGEVAPRPPVPLPLDGVEKMRQELEREGDAARVQAGTLRREEHIPDPPPPTTKPLLPGAGHRSDTGAFPKAASLTQDGIGQQDGTGRFIGRATGAAIV